MLVEDRSTSTRENLRYASQLLAVREPGPSTSTVVTSSYHAFRAAVEARLAGVDAQAVGSPTAPYFWLNATLREFVAFLREHRVAHAVMLVLTAVPVPLAPLVLPAIG